MLPPGPFDDGRMVIVMGSKDSEALFRHPIGGVYDGHRCTCTAVCDGVCGSEACTRAWFDSASSEVSKFQ
jgi:hypothetical protein